MRSARGKRDGVGCSNAGGGPTRSVMRRLVPIALLLGAGLFARFVWLRVTLRPTPRPEYWIQQIEALNPPQPGMLGIDDSMKLLEQLPKPSDPSADASALIDPIKRATWDESRPDTAALVRLVMDPSFAGLRERLIVASRRGLRIPPRLWSGPERSSVPVRRCVEEWALCLLAHARWLRENHGRADLLLEDWLAVIRLNELGPYGFWHKEWSFGLLISEIQATA